VDVHQRSRVVDEGVDRWRRRERERERERDVGTGRRNCGRYSNRTGNLRGETGVF